MGNYYDTVRVLRTVNEAIVNVWRCSDGGWTNHPPKRLQSRHSGVWSTAQGILWLLDYDPEQYHDKILAGVNRLVALRHRPGIGLEVTDGGWGAQLEGPSDAVGTALALLALLRYVQRTEGDIPKDYEEAIYGALEWLLGTLVTEGGWGSRPNYPSASGMFCGCLALQEYLESRLPDDARVDRGLTMALGVIANSRKGGGWAQFIREEKADAIGTAYCTAALLSGEFANNYQVLQMARTGAQWLLMNNRTHNGIWEVDVEQSQIEATAWAVMALLATGEIAEAEAAVTYLTGAGGPLGWPASPGPNAKPRFYSTYYAARALLQYRDAKRKARALPPSQVGNRVFIVRQIADPKVKSAAMDKVVQFIQQQKSELVPVLLEAGTYEALRASVEREAKQSGIDFAMVLIEDAMVSSGALDVAGTLSGEIGPEFVTVLYERNRPYPQGLSPVKLVQLGDANWKAQIKELLHNARLVVDA